MRPNRDLAKLDPVFRRKLEAVFSDIAGHGLRLDIVEGWRSVKRQQYLYSQGRTRPGPIVTYKDGAGKQSYHQSGKAADVIFADVNSGNRYYPPSGSAEWKLLESSCDAHGLTWGGTWRMKDMPHVELS